MLKERRRSVMPRRDRRLLMVLVISLAVTATSQHIFANSPKLEKLPVSTDLLRAHYPKRVPRYIGDRVMAVFENPNGNGPSHRAVAEAMRHDARMLEILSTDSTVLHGPTWTKVLKRREEILKIVEKLLALPEEKIDIWDASVILSKDAFPNLNIRKLNREFDVFVSRAGLLANRKDNPDFHVRALNTFIYKRWGIEYDKADYLGRNLINRYAHGVLTTRKGTCANLATFYIAVAQRLGFPVKAVSAPQHLFARYDDPRLLFQNIDPSGQGGYSPDAEYIEDMEIPSIALEKGTFMRTMSNRELLAEIIADHATAYYAEELKDYATAIMILDRALVNSPKAADYWYVMGQIYKNWGSEEVVPKMRETKYTRGFVFMQKSKRMGKGKPLEEGYWKKLQQKKGKGRPGA